MRRLVFTLLFITLLPVSPAFAQNATAASQREERRAQITARLEARKQQIIERIQTNLNRINERRTDHFLKFLDRLQKILDRIESRKDKAAAAGKDVSAVETAIDDAQSAIDAAKEAVIEQQAQTYQIVVDDETTARNDVGATVKKLQEDLRTTRGVVAAARTAVHNALRALVSIAGVDDTATSSATPGGAL